MVGISDDESASISKLRVDWIDERFTEPGRLGLTLLPGRWDRDMPEDLGVLAREGIAHVVCLVPKEELTRYGAPGLLEEYQTAGLEVRHQPIVDLGVPSFEEMVELVGWIARQLEGGGRILVHCVGGLGRSGTVVACYLRSRGLGPEDALAEVRRARGPRTVESAVQEEFVRAYEHPAS